MDLITIDKAEQLLKSIENDRDYVSILYFMIRVALNEKRSTIDLDLVKLTVTMHKNTRHMIYILNLRKIYL